MTSFTTKCITPVLCCLYPGNLRCVKFDSMLSRLSPTKGVPGDQRDRIDVKFPIPHPLLSRKLKKPYITFSSISPYSNNISFLPPTYLFNPDFSLVHASEPASFLEGKRQSGRHSTTGLARMS